MAVMRAYPAAPGVVRRPPKMLPRKEHADVPVTREQAAGLLSSGAQGRGGESK